jgi:hypothetical protein
VLFPESWSSTLPVDLDARFVTPCWHPHEREEE